MKTDILNAEDISTEVLKELLDEAYMEVAIDEDGDLLVTDGVPVYVLTGPEGQFVRFVTLVKPREDASSQERVEFVNWVNHETVGLRAAVRPDDSLQFDYLISTDGGVTKGNIVLSLKLFYGLVFLVADSPEFQSMVPAESE